MLECQVFKRRPVEIINFIGEENILSEENIEKQMFFQRRFSNKKICQFSISTLKEPLSWQKISKIVEKISKNKKLLILLHTFR